MRQGVTDLFDLCRRAGYATGAFSEAPDIFTGLSYADHIAPLPTDEQLTGWLQRREPTILFLHYWSVHPPYGAADGLAFGEVGQLLAAGRIDVVQARYRAAIEQLFERHIAQLLAALDLSTHGPFSSSATTAKAGGLTNPITARPCAMTCCGCLCITDFPRRNPSGAP